MQASGGKLKGPVRGLIVAAHKAKDSCYTFRETPEGATKMLLPHRKMLLAVAAAGIGVTLMSAAQAFTFEDGNGGKASAGGDAGGASSLRFGPGDSRFMTGTGNGTTSNAPGRSSFSSGPIQFNSQSSFDQRYSSDRMFDSNNILGRDR